MFNLRFAAYLALGLASALAVGQDSGQTVSGCLAKDEVVHKPGEKNLKPPKLDIYPAEQMPEGVLGSFALEVLVNSKGRVCDVHLVKASDAAAGTRVTKHIAQHWKFKPATLDGKAVTVAITVNLNLGE